MSERRLVRARLPALAGILLLAAVLRLWGITWGLQNANISRRPHPDEWTVYWLFRWFDSSHSLNPCPQQPKQCFFDWGMAYPYLAYGVHAVISPVLTRLPAHSFGSQADLGFVLPVLAARLTSVALSVLTVYVAYRLGRRAYGDATGLVAALVTALCTLLIQLAHFGTPDSTTNLLLALALWAIMACLERPGNKTFLLAGIAIGAATGSEYHMALLAIPLIVAWLIGASRRLHLLASSVAGALAAFLVLNPYILIEFPAFLAATEHTLSIRSVNSGVQYGARWAPYAPSILFVVRYPLGYGVGIALTIWMLLAAGWAAIRRRRADLVLFAWILPYFVLVTIEPAKFMRYSAPLLVPLAVLAGRLAVDLWNSTRNRARLAVLAATLLAASFSAIYDAAYAGLFASPDPRAVTGAWVAAHGAARQAVAYEEIPDGVANLALYLPASLTPCIDQFHLQRLRGVRYVLLDSYTREEQSASNLAALARFQTSLAHSPSYALALNVHYVPTFLGLTFPIDGSPHDWRYPSHVITVYRQLHPASTLSAYCYHTLAQATRALYVHTG